MAAVFRACFFVVFVCVISSSQSFGDHGNYGYNVGRRKETDSVDVFLLDSSPRDSPSRTRRYVDTVIPRLADNYVSPVEKGEFDSSSKRRDVVMDMVGNVAVAAGSGGTPADATTPPPPSSSPKPSSPPSSPSDKKDPLEDKEMSKTTKKILANSPAKVTVQTVPNNSSGEAHHDSVGDMYSIKEDDVLYPKAITNSTLSQYNITSRKDDHHHYYNSSFQIDPVVGKHYWVNMTVCAKSTKNEILSSSHRRATTVKLDFDFPFYGHTVRNIAIATGGFLYTGDYIHSWLAATQYIAPLMANFDTSLSPSSQVKYCDNGTAFTVEWENAILQDRTDAGYFTFQVTLHKNGDIIFVYKSIPILVEDIEDSLHPVKVGVSDAYIIDRTVFFVRRKTIYEYHRVNFRRDDIKNWTVIHLKALPTCLEYKTCETCMEHETQFDCKWCPSASRCSSGFDRLRQDWQWKHCDVANVGGSNASACADVKAYKDFDPPSSNKLDSSSSMHSDSPQVATVVADQRNSSEKGSTFSHTGMMGLLLFVLMITGIGLWVMYAYRNPHTQSGQVLIKYRPSQWALRRGEARYTAASIHM